MPPAPPGPLPAAVLLCAGGSTRMGRPKPLLPWGTPPRTLLEAHLEALDGWEIVVVTGAGAELLRPLLCQVTEVWNHAWQTTRMGDSAQLAARRLDRGAVFVPIDTVPDAKILALLRERTVSTVPVDIHGRRGHPLLLSREDVESLARANDPSLRPYSLAAEPLVTSSALCAEDFDTPEALRRMREEVARGGLEPPTPRV